ncbi:TolC family protein [Lebetimonas sp. JS138]|uniref:TolC family protein n=1 Tax=Lebetimonas sp. JS138 TaxID=990072 RepID=UPI0004677862|nr:TolC family protein [Lebetimonas sp. JS138]
MKRLALIFPLFLRAESFNDIAKSITNSLNYKLAKKQVEIYEKKLKLSEAKNYGSVDLSYAYVRLHQNPVMKMNTDVAVGAQNAGSAPVYPLIYQNVNTEIQAGRKNNFTGVLKYSYPLFTGFAITNLIKKSKIELIQKKLELKNTKRVLLLNAAKLYSNIYALNAKIDALNKAKAAVISAKEKAFSFYKEGLLNKSEADEIDAKYYEINAKIDSALLQKKALLNIFSNLVNKKIKKIDGLNVPSLKEENILKRPDVLAIKENLNLSETMVNLAKSKFYPQIGIEIGLKKEANTFGLDQNYYQNRDKSYGAVELNYNIFDGGADKANIEEAKIAKLQSLIYYQNYLNSAETEYKNDLLKIKALKEMYKSAKSEVEARLSYYEYINAKFEEGLADSADLTDAIAKLAAARAKKEDVKSQIFFYTIKANLDGGSNF